MFAREQYSNNTFEYPFLPWAQGQLLKLEVELLLWSTLSEMSQDIKREHRLKTNLVCAVTASVLLVSPNTCPFH